MRSYLTYRVLPEVLYVEILDLTTALTKKDGADGVIHRQVVRLSTSYYKTKRGYAVRRDLITLKRKSSGHQILDEEVYNIGPEEALCNIINLDSCKDGVYEITVCNVTKDWESGYADDWDLKLVPYAELST